MHVPAIDVVTFGEAMVVIVPDRVGPLESVERFSRIVAGSESNVAIGLARLGHRVRWISRVGNDPFGRLVIRQIRGEGVDVSQVQTAENERTGVLFKEMLSGGETRAHYYRHDSAATRLRLDQVKGEPSRYLFVTGITPALSVQNREVTIGAVQHYHAAGTKIVFDPNMRYKLWDPAAAVPVFREIIAVADLVLPGIAEGHLITGQAEPRAIAETFREMGARQIVIKLGPAGAYFHDEKSSGTADAMAVEQIDPVGAGDAFGAGVLAALLAGHDLSEAARWGCAAGALCVTALGDTTALPDLAALHQFLARQAVIER